MKTMHLILVLFLFPFGQVFSQSAPGKYFVQFTDKANNLHSLHNPEKFLSTRALERRKRQNIKLDSLDLPVSQAYLDALAQQGAKIIHKSKWFNAATIEASPEIISKIGELLFVEKIEKAPAYKLIIEANPLESQVIGYGCEYNSPESDPYGNTFYQLKMVNGNALHCAGFTGEGMLIGVLDGGFYKVDEMQAFQRLWENGKIEATWDFVEGGKLNYGHSAHGMFVLSIMGGFLHDKMIGTAPDASYLLLRTEDGPTEFRIEEDNWVAGAEFADSAGVDVINSSLGYTVFDDPMQNYSYKDMDGKSARVTIGANIAASRGILVVNSAGNQGDKEWQKIGAPADGEGVLAIGAVDFTGENAEFSSLGPSFDGRLKPDVTAMGKGTVIASLQDGEVVSGNGTSFSAPIISGMAACLWQAFPYKTNWEIAEAIRKSGGNSQKPDTVYGYGIPDFNKAFQLLKGSEVLPGVNILPIAVYPNPFNGYLEITYRFPQKEEVLLELFSHDGRPLFNRSFDANAGSFGRYYVNDASALPSGLYFLRIQAGETRIVQKLVKQ